MTEKEFKNLKVGDKVKFFRDSTNLRIWSEGLDGKILTVSHFFGNGVNVFENTFIFHYKWLEVLKQ